MPFFKLRRGEHNDVSRNFLAPVLLAMEKLDSDGSAHEFVDRAAVFFLSARSSWTTNKMVERS